MWLNKNLQIMQRKQFLLTALGGIPLLTFAQFDDNTTSTRKPFTVEAGKGRFGEVIKFLGVHPNNNKISGPAPKMPHHSIYFPENYDAEFDDIFEKKIPVSEPTIYICVPNDPKMVKGENLEAWSILINAPRHEPGSGWDWNKDSSLYAAKIIAKLDELGLQVSERLEVMEFETPANLENSVGAPGGSIYGTSSNGARSAFMRAKNTSPLKNLFCVGGSAHPGGGLPLVGISAEIVAEAIGRK
jgi:phytoene dehydrogenase-like protein